MKLSLKFKKKIDFWLGGFGIFLIFLPVRILGKVLRRNHDLQRSRHFLVIKMLGGGNLLQIHPFIYEMKKRKPDVKISILCSQSIKGFANEYGFFDQVRIIDDSNFVKLLISSAKQLVWMFANVDTTIDLEVHSRLTTLLSTFSLVRNRIGLIDHHSLWRKRIYTHSIFVNILNRIPDYYDSLLRLLDVHKLEINDARHAFASRFQGVPLRFSREPSDVLIAIGVGCSDLSKERMLNNQEWIDLLNKIATKFPNVLFAFLGNKNDGDVAQRILDAGPTIKNRARNLCGQLSLSDSMNVLSKSTVFMGIDSALLHIARYLNVKSISFWGPTNPQALLRLLNLDELTFYRNLSCSPCVHFTETPPCLGQNFCMSENYDETKIFQFLEKAFNSTPVFNSLLTPNKIFAWSYSPEDETAQKLFLEQT